MCTRRHFVLQMHQKQEKKGTKHHKKTLLVHAISLFVFFCILFLSLSSSSPSHQKKMLKTHKFSHSSRVRMTKAAFEKQSLQYLHIFSLHAKTAFGSVKLDIYQKTPLFLGYSEGPYARSHISNPPDFWWYL